jgi:hypothetical protein
LSGAVVNKGRLDDPDSTLRHLRRDMPLPDIPAIMEIETVNQLERLDCSTFLATLPLIGPNVIRVLIIGFGFTMIGELVDLL